MKKSTSSLHECLFRAERGSSAKPIYPDLSSHAVENNFDKQNRRPNPSAPIFEDIRNNQENKPAASPSAQRKSTKPQDMNARYSDDQHMFDANKRGSQSEKESNGVVFLLNGAEQLSVRFYFLLIDILIFLFFLR